MDSTETLYRIRQHVDFKDAELLTPKEKVLEGLEIAGRAGDAKLRHEPERYAMHTHGGLMTRDEFEAFRRVTYSFLVASIPLYELGRGDLVKQMVEILAAAERGVEADSTPRQDESQRIEFKGVVAFVAREGEQP